MRKSPAYKTYLAFATGVAAPMKARKFKKLASPSKSKSLVDIEEPAEKPGKKPATRIQSAGVQIRDTLGKSIDTSKGTSLKPGVPDVSKADSSESEYKSWGYSDDDDDDQQDDEEYDRINEEMYSDVNVELKDTELEGKGKYDEKMTDVGYVDAEQENVNQEVAGDQVKDDAQATITAALATQKTEVPLQSSFISFDYATKFLNFDNIPSADTEIISMIDIKVQHKDTSIQTLPLLIVPISLSIIEHSLKFEVPTVVKEYLGTSLDYTLHKVIQRHTAELIKEHSVPTDVIEVPQQQQKPQKSVADIRKIKMEQAGKQQETKYIITSSDTTELQEFNQKRTLMKIPWKKVRLKKRKPNDADKDEGPHARSNQGLKRKKASRDAEPSKKAKSTETSKGTTKLQ
ncbi:hypothetical protein Tco_1499089 [Tanacetum coccineum]